MEQPTKTRGASIGSLPPERIRRAVRLRLLALLALAAATLAIAFSLPPMAQDPGYHSFADGRTLAGIPNFWNVVSNIPFLVVGAIGLRRALRNARSLGRPSQASVPSAMPAVFAIALAAGTFLTGIGSAWYHLDPGNGTLVLDRLPMTLVFAAILGGLVATRLHAGAGFATGALMLVLGLASVVLWHRSELGGSGDLRFYGWVQGFTCLAAALVIPMGRRDPAGTRRLLLALGLYVAAKLAEIFDGPIGILAGVVSGHPIKHLLAAMATWQLVLALVPGEKGHGRSSSKDGSFVPEAVLKKDVAGCVERGDLVLPGAPPATAVRRDWSRTSWFARPVAGLLAAREARALARLSEVRNVPHLLERADHHLIRTWIPGVPLHEARPSDPAWFTAARRLLRDVHGALVTHNDTHKEPNWLVTESGEPALVDFQLASRFRRRTRWFRLLALEDLRHLLKHKRTCCPSSLTAQERSLLARRSWPARWWRRLAKPPYLWMTRHLLGWRDREGRGFARGAKERG